jgi:hypothetical protein
LRLGGSYTEPRPARRSAGPGPPARVRARVSSSDGFIMVRYPKAVTSYVVVDKIVVKSLSQNTQLYESVKSRTNQARVGYGTYKEDVPYWDSNFSCAVRIATYEVVWSK